MGGGQGKFGDALNFSDDEDSPELPPKVDQKFMNRDSYQPSDNL